MKKVLFVCLGNICRSPMAEGIFKDKILQMGKQGEIESDSAGTAAYHVGESPDHRTMDVLSKHDIHFQHAARKAIKEDAERFDFILAMDAQNYEDLQMLFEGRQSQLFKMRDFDPEQPGADVPDPYYGGADGFQKVYEMLDRSIDQFIKEKLI